MSQTTPHPAAYVTVYWGKARPCPDGDMPFHPLAYHGLDVAAAGDALLTARPALLDSLAATAQLPRDLVRRWLLFGLALHDLGKYADCFQCKVEAHWHHRDSSFCPTADPGHGRMGAWLWASGCSPHVSRSHPYSALFGTGPAAGMSKRQFELWLTPLFGHHGRPVTADMNGRLPEYARPGALADADAYVRACAALFDPAVAPEVVIDSEAIRRSSWLVAGIGMLADWIGSNQEWFPYTSPVYDLATYWVHAQERASAAIVKSGLNGARIAAGYGIADALPSREPSEPPQQATPLQSWAETVALDGPSLIVVEDLTGAGKTEAGLILAHRLMRAGAAEGLYWALPTMATADVLYRRLASSYGRLFKDARSASLVLAHSARAFNDVFQKSIALDDRRPEASYGPASENDGDGNVTSTAACARWIADDRRKAFLADVGIGTIDQAVLGVLPSKHQAMRLAGLARRVLVIDEIHSLDAYQNALVERLLTFHAGLGGSAILISATLTVDSRQRLAAAFAKGAGWPMPSLADARFPLATVVSRSSVREHAFAPVRGTRRDLPVRRLDSAEAAFDVMADAARDGRAAIWIRNTVQDALDAFAEVRARLPSADVGVFHARFALGDRLRIQDDVMASFGKASRGDVRCKLLISTQVCEQSIDADWDVMITDLAPIDLIIQRAGRLHRHDRGPRPPPVLHVVAPEPTADADGSWYAALFPRGQYVYPHHGQLWLTMKALTEARGLNLASGDPRALIEAVYGPAATYPAGLDAPSVRAEGTAASASGIGRQNALKFHEGYKHVAGDWGSDTYTPTRLGDPQRVIRLARWEGGLLEPWIKVEDGDRRRAWRLSEVSVLARRVAAFDPVDAAVTQAMSEEVATWPESYDPPLLVPLRPDGGDWIADVIDGGDKPLRLRYANTVGLRFEPL